MDKALFELLYTSERRDEVPAAEVGLLVERARRRNAETGVTGVLLFDGARFCQFLEGPEGAVLDPMRRIRADPRHRNVVRVHESVIGARRLKSWYLGYVQIVDLGAIDRIAALRGADAVAGFYHLLPRVDFGLDGNPLADAILRRAVRGSPDGEHA